MAILIVFAGKDGFTQKVCQYIQTNVTKLLVKNKNHQACDIVNISQIKPEQLNKYRTVIFGSSVHYGKHDPIFCQFVDNNFETLNRIKTAFFSINLTARKSDKNTVKTNPYIAKFLASTKWQPKQLAVFAGKLNYPKYSFYNRLMIQFIMWLTDGPTSPNHVEEFIDWRKVDSFSLQCVND